MKSVIKNWIETITIKWIIVGFLGYTVVMIGGVYLLLNPQVKRYQEAVDKQVGLNDTYINLVSLDIEAAIDSMELDLEELQIIYSDFKKRLLQKSVNTILPVIDRYCTESQLEVNKLEPLNKTTFIQPNYQKQFIEIALVGSYTNFLRFLKKLELNREWILIENLRITPLESTTQNRFSLVLAVLRERDKA